MDTRPSTDDPSAESSHASSFSQLNLWDCLFQGKRKDLIRFSRNVATMLEGGLSIDRILLMQGQHAKNRQFRKALDEIAQIVARGESFSGALVQQSAVFDELYISIVKAGEQSGKLEQALNRNADLLESRLEMQRKIMMLMAYPTMVLVSLSIAVAIFAILIVPGLLDAAQAALGGLSGSLAVIKWLPSFWWVLPMFPMAVIFGMICFYNTRIGRQIVHELVLYVPFLNETVQYLQSSYFISGVLMAYSAGLSLPAAAGLGVRSMTNLSVQEYFGNVERQLSRGKSLIEVLKEVAYLPDSTLEMIDMGETAGSLEKMLQTALNELHRETDAKIQALMTLLKPLLLLMAAAVFGCGLLLIYGTIFSTIGQALRQAVDGSQN